MIAGQENPLLDRVWGVSHAEDRIWAQICGIAPGDRPWERLFMALHAYIDDSYTANGTFVLAGYVASVEKWAAFSKEWEFLLPLTYRNKHTNKHRFKMSEMAHRMERVLSFYNVITNHALSALSCKIDIADLTRAKERIWGENLIINWAFADRPFSFCFACLMGTFHEIRARHDPDGLMAMDMPIDTPIDFYFDMRSEKREIWSAWDNFCASQEEDDIRVLYGSEPRFENDEVYLPLQAADFWAWWVRKGYENGKLQEYRAGIFDGWRGAKVPGVEIWFDEDAITGALIKLVREKLAPGHPVYDAKFHPRGSRTGIGA